VPMRNGEYAYRHAAPERVATIRIHGAEGGRFLGTTTIIGNDKAFHITSSSDILVQNLVLADVRPIGTEFK
jgi:hypothetical protein